MQARPQYPAGVPCWIDLMPPDPDAAVRFYADLFGWSFVDRGPGGTYRTAQLEGLDVAAIGAPTSTAASPPAWTMYVATDDIDESLARARAAGGQVIEGPADLPRAGRSAIVEDPAGARVGLWQAQGRIGAQLVNAAGTWNFNELTTTDADGAEAFYGAVFGWKAVSVDFGLEASTMFVLPGYGDFLASLDPTVKERHAEAALPTDFTNCVAWLGPADTSARPGWATTFAVDDPDPVAARAEQLGGRVLEPPRDNGPVRQALIEDPQGARFTAASYRGDA